MKALIGNAILIGLAVAAASVAGCSSGSSTNGHPNTASSTENGTGAIGLQLTLPGGAVLNTISYTVNGPNGAATIVTSGTIPVANSTSIFFETPDNIPVGNGYTVTLTGGDDAGDTCLGTSVPFTVTSRTSTPVLVQLQCHGAANLNGGITVTGVTSNCATWQSISPATSDIVTGTPDGVLFTATGPDHGSLTYSATVAGAGAATVSPATGLVSFTSGGSATVTCTSPGLVTVTFVFGDGPLPAGGSCDTTLNTVSFPVQCEGAPVIVEAGPPPPVDAGPPVVDAGPPVVDAGPPVVDAGPTLAQKELVVEKKFNKTATVIPVSDQFFFNKDVANGDTTTFKCATCMLNNDCVDNSSDGISGVNCEDLTANATGGAQAGTSKSILCENLLSCIFATAPTCAAGGDTSICYCGAAFAGNACQTITAAQLATNGETATSATCPLGNEQTMANALEFALTDPVDILGNFTDPARGGGAANSMFACAVANNCSTCWQ